MHGRARRPHREFLPRAGRRSGGLADYDDRRRRRRQRASPCAGGESMKRYTVVGTRPIRHDGADKVTGRALYGADYQTAGLLHGFILRSPHAHARILRVDTSKAAAFPGVKAVVTAADLPGSAE